MSAQNYFVFKVGYNESIVCKLDLILFITFMLIIYTYIEAANYLPDVENHAIEQSFCNKYFILISLDILKGSRKCVKVELVELPLSAAGQGRQVRLSEQ